MTNRRQEAEAVRASAAKLAANRPHPRHVANGDEQKFRKNTGGPSYLASFTKGLPHCFESGLVQDASSFELFVAAINSGAPADFVATPLGPPGFDPDNPEWLSDKANEFATGDSALRAWESQGAGHSFDLEGPDAQAVTMPPAPAMGSEELSAEIGEVYVQALLRDVPFTQIAAGRETVRCGRANPTSGELIGILAKLPWFQRQAAAGENAVVTRRRRGPLTPHNAFRGITPGDEVGPYLSQFLLAGNAGIHRKDAETSRSAGRISYGAATIDQRVRVAQPGLNYMTTWKEWFDVQQGANLTAAETYLPSCKGGRRFITTPRDLATYVHYDALYEAYLNACLLLLGNGIPFDPGLPFQAPDYRDHQQAFAHFGGPHILSLVTEVATRALKAVRYQKFNVHRRMRPEALAARFARRRHADVAVPEVQDMARDLGPLLDVVQSFNPTDPDLPDGNTLLPMAFCEGSPMHPSYGAGHATVAGACVTVLKAFFDHKHPLAVTDDRVSHKGYVPSANGAKLVSVDIVDAAGQPASLTVEGELNKLASNISIGRNWAGVHYFTDYIESVRMGEQIAIGILEEQKLTYRENFSMTIPLFDGGSIQV